MKKKNVLQFADFGASYSGNFFASLLSLERKLTNFGVVTVFALPFRAKKQKWVYDILEDKNVYILSKFMLFNIFIIIKILKKHQIGIIHTHFSWVKWSLVIKIANIFFQAKTVRHIHSRFPEMNCSRFKIKKKIINADFFIACSLEVEKDLIINKYSKQKIFLIKNAIDFSRLDTSVKLNRKDYGISNEVCILMFGYNFFVKGVDIALKALNEINKIRNEKVILLIPIKKNNVVDFLIKVKSILGYLPDWINIIEPRNDISSYIHMVDIFLSASRSEGFSYALVENAYLKKVIIASDIKVHLDLGLNGLITFITENYNDLVCVVNKTINTLYPNKERILEEDRQYVIREYGLERWTSSIINLFSKIIDLEI